MHKITLNNGLKVLYQPKKGNSVVVEVLVNVGSNHEQEHERGISHFLEHMVFEGTKKRPNNWLISNEIEKVGGNFNAYTTNERTCFYVKVLKKHFHLAVEVLADIIQNPLFRKEELDKEKNVVIKEIDLVNDEPKFYQWILLQKNLFKDHPAGLPTYGSKKVIQGLNREKVLDYYNKYYLPNNLIVSIVGEVKDWKKIVEKEFTFSRGRKPEIKNNNSAPLIQSKIVKEKKDVSNTYLVFGFKTVPRNHRDSPALEIIDAILGRGQSGKMFTEIRGKKGLAYDVGTEHISDVDFGYFAIYATIDSKNLQKVKKTVFEQLQQLQEITEKELEEAKTYIEGDYYLDLEDNQRVADQLLFWEQIGDAKKMDQYINSIKKVTLSEVKKMAQKYFHNFVQVVIEK
jgi:predicted Zn-dependent peptidase